MRNAKRERSEVAEVASSLTEVTAASALDPKFKTERISTDVGPFDLALSGGVKKSQSILLAGAPGSRKSSIAAMVLQGLSKRTQRKLLYVSAEQNKDSVIEEVFALNGVDSAQIILHANDAYYNNISDILKRCAIIKPFAAVFDSLGPIAYNSGLSVDLVAKATADYCQRTKMICILVGQVTTDGLSFKGGLGPAYHVDTLMLYENFKPSLDGDPIKLFGKKNATEIIGWTEQMARLDFVENLRILRGGAHGKNRKGPANTSAYIFTNIKGEMIHIPTVPPKTQQQQQQQQETVV